MNKKHVLLSILVGLAYQLSAQKTGDSWATVKANGSGSLAIVYYEQAGLIQDVNGKPEGLWVEILKDFVDFVQAKHNKKISLQYVG